MSLITLILGLVFILIGAHLLTDGASALAQKFKVSNLVIGLTVVAFGTSAPELSVSAMAALKGSADMAIGNVVGSNLFNTLLIIGCTALIAPIRISKSTLLKEIPLCILAAAVLWIAANDQLLAGAKTNTLNRIEGLLFLGFLTIFISHTFTIARNSNSSTDNETAPITKMCTLKAGSYIIIGLVGLIFGGQWFIEGATIVARLLGLSESTIALTLVAGGTSFPELATSIVAAKKNNPEMAIGNAIGSNLFNIFLVLGSCATLTPLPLGNITNFDLISLLVSSIVLWFVGVFIKKRKITKSEGALLVLLYIAYMIVLFLHQ
jgi:cation:H+ antiporter